ncbi:hypothetical protein BU24DRAFT_76108 [Aaosphaeria arxii CBS 175.79]|uniref:Zn(2)-C6 fungal-type domain-containing protein n=1 Tax=Aaosphaeria arxii CBS 175.79 TaxID=1450172 RepID=A0A6A5X9S7_9PLEO|nr:uncharacterized protein BU24DRAFT_76108 [Aaosphaeria arxii CBS 175.79]KAF2009504.1 hypothetical protein BU24DRAFT_76108 [Aaosphaeria arxii CBS 175.79]
MDELSHALRPEDDAPDSPKRKKKRTKYTSKACVTCRRSKLKCSGESPCQRCLDNGRTCHYDEQPIASNGTGVMRSIPRQDVVERERRGSDSSVLGIAEVLQNLSRPTLAQPLNTANSPALSRRNLVPHNEGSAIERRASDASLLGLSMEARMARIEGMMEALIQDRSVMLSPRGSMEREDTASDSLRGDATFDIRMETFGAISNTARQKLKLSNDSPELQVRQPVPATSPPQQEGRSTIRTGTKDRTFPTLTDYQRYIDFFFSSVNPYLPCINEAEFRAHSEQMLSSVDIPERSMCLLALNYVIFACVDILLQMLDTGSNVPGGDSNTAGWHWFQIAEEVLGNRPKTGRGRMVLVQVLTWEAFYLMHNDMPNAAYNVVGLACRLCYQYDLHQQPFWSGYTPFEIHMCQRIFWCLYFSDRRIALSCGQPYCLRDSDIEVDQPPYIADRDLFPDRPLPNIDPSRSANMYLRLMIAWGRFAGEVYDLAFVAVAAKHGLDGEKAAQLESRITDFTRYTLAAMPLIPPNQAPEPRHLRQHILSHTRFNNLRLFLRRTTMLSLNYDGKTGVTYGDIALDTIQRFKPHAREAKIPSPLRFHMATTLSHSLLILASLILRDLSSIGIQDRKDLYTVGYLDAKNILQEIAAHNQVARRIVDDFRSLFRSVSTALNNREIGTPNWANDHFNPSDFPVRSRLGHLREKSLPSDSWDAEFQQSPEAASGIIWT